MHAFNYKSPSSLAEAAEMLQNSQDGLLLAGGHTLLPTLKQRLSTASDLIDLGGVAGLNGISVSGDSVKIGAMTKHAEVAASLDVKRAIPALSDLASTIGDPQVRNCGTIGGSIANSDPAADYPAALVGLGATVNTNRRSISADDFFVGMFETALDEGEIITSVTFPVVDSAGYCKFPNPASRYAIVGVFVSRSSSGVRVAVTGAGPNVFRVREMEAVLSSSFSPASVENISVSAEGLNSDIHASAEYRAHLVTIMAKRAVAAAAS